MTSKAMTLERTALPRVGVGHAGTTRGGQRLGVISHLDGRREIVLYDADDPDRAAFTVALEPSEARHLADLLNATITIDHITDLERRVDGLTAARIRLPLRSAFGGRPLQDTRAGTGTGAAAIVAVIRDEHVLAAPGPDFVLRHDDVVVTVGDAHGVTVLTDLLTTVADPPSVPHRDTGRPAAKIISRLSSRPVAEQHNESTGPPASASSSPDPTDRRVRAAHRSNHPLPAAPWRRRRRRR
jgi:TrkA domain protein